MKCLRFKPFMAVLAAIFGWFSTPTMSVAVPAPRRPVEVVQPDGSVLSVFKAGDEFLHVAFSSEGYTLKADNQGIYRYAIHNEIGQLVAGPVKALAQPPTDPSTVAYLQTLQKRLLPSNEQRQAALKARMSRANAEPSQLRAASGSFEHILLNHATRSGENKSLVILVNFKDQFFSNESPNTAFSNLLNQSGYNLGNHIGSVKDYFSQNSNGAYSPDFVVVGPVTLANNYAYYGANNPDDNDNDIRAREMVREACLAAANLVDFAQFDSDNNGTVDNVYVFYAGKGEADGGDANTIWPHSYSLGNLSLLIDGKKVNTYACSAELKGNGQMTGIGVFTHEYGHVLGLPDMYDVDYDQYNGDSFDVDTWSLMAQGAYNGGGAIPAGLTLLERYLIGWATPQELTAPSSLVLQPLITSNQGFIIKTDNTGEFFLLENRQNLSGTFDQALSHHGLLVYHIDMRSNATTTVNYYGETYTWTFEKLWQYNMVNAIASHQCADIIEADNEQVINTGYNYSVYLNSLKGDPFPGVTNVTSITPETFPSLATWSGKALDKPLTVIREEGTDILFNFMGGTTFMETPRIKSATDIYPFSFVVSWQPVIGATRYLLDVFTLEINGQDSIKHYVDGYEERVVKDTVLTIVVPNDLTGYYYQVRSTNGYSISASSPIMSLTTTNSQAMALEPTLVNAFGFTAHWNALPWATGYYLTLYEVTDIQGSEWLTPVSAYVHYYTTDTSLSLIELDNDRAYAYVVQGTTGTSTGTASDRIYASTLAADSVHTFLRNGVLYFKGIDKGSPIKLIDLSGKTVQISNDSTFIPNVRGFFLAEIRLQGRKRILKILID